MYVHPKEFRKNFLAYVKFAVAVHQFTWDRVLFFRICLSYALGAPPTLLRGKLGVLRPGPAALLPRTRPSSNGINRLYGHGFYGIGLRQRIRNAGNQASVT